jgi:hypothetical protein
MLELLDIKYSDPVVREYAVWYVNIMRDQELKEYFLQVGDDDDDDDADDDDDDNDDDDDKSYV